MAEGKLSYYLIGGVALGFGLFALFPYFLPWDWVRPNLHENAILVGLFGMASLILGGFLFGFLSGVGTKKPKGLDGVYYELLPLEPGEISEMREYTANPVVYDREGLEKAVWPKPSREYRIFIRLEG